MSSATNGVATPIGDPGSIALPDGTLITAERFFAERDQRTQIGSPFVRPRFVTGIALGRGVETTAAGQTALLWAASMIRRMGRPFAQVRLVAQKAAREAKYLGSLHQGVALDTLAEAIDLELLGADPFSAFEWVDVADANCFEQLDAILCIGCGAPADTDSHAIAIELSARGWVLRRKRLAATSRRTGSQARADISFDCAAATAVAAAALGVAEVYNTYRQEVALPGASTGEPVHLDESVSDSSSSTEQDVVYWSVDSGCVTTTAEGELWLARGSSEQDSAPWSSESATVPHLPNTVLISTGGIGGNLAQILAASRVIPGRISLVDPDRVEIGNLNRLIGVLTSDVGSPKVTVYQQPLAIARFKVELSDLPYEEWSVANRVLLDAADATCVVGADQVVTRLEAQADWPFLLLNGSTAGTTWVVSIHFRDREGCLGCLFASDRRSYAVTRGPQACAAGGAGVGRTAPELMDASYPFVSVSAAAALAAVLIRQAWMRSTSGAATLAGESQMDSIGRPRARTNSVIRMNARTPAFAQVAELTRSPACLLLCSDDAVVELFAFGAVGESKV